MLYNYITRKSLPYSGIPTKRDVGFPDEIVVDETVRNYIFDRPSNFGRLLACMKPRLCNMRQTDERSLLHVQLFSKIVSFYYDTIKSITGTV